MKTSKQEYSRNKVWKKRHQELQTQVEAMKRILWAVLDTMEGGEITIPEVNLTKAHTVTGDFDFELKDDGSAHMKRNIK